MLPQARPGRSLSLKNAEQIPAALLVGDYLIAPLYEWAERLRSDALPLQTNGQNDEQQIGKFVFKAKNTSNYITFLGDDSSSMPGTPCLNSACGEEFDPNAGKQFNYFSVVSYFN